ncbi:MAG: lysophospholipid acyltransferase family protein [Clostridia bacterium]
MTEELQQIYNDRLNIVNKIKEYEKEGGEKFFCDVENDPPTKILLPKDVDYLEKKLSSKIKTFIAVLIVNQLKKYALKRFEMEIEGEENFQNIPTGAIITTNHFSQYESLCVMNALAKAREKRKMHIIVKEGNFNMTGKAGYILKHYYTLPLSSNTQTMINFNKAIEKILNDKKFILIYPEQSMWWNYRKPKPLKIGAFHYAVKYNVPVIPCFVTMKNIEGVDEFGFPNQKYTIHIMPAIYPSTTLSHKESAQKMLNANELACKEKYEQVYGIPLQYNGDNFLV